MPDWESITRRIARKKHVDPNLFAAQIGAESNFDPNADSGFAKGIAQITPDTAQAWGVNPNKPRQALRASASHMHDYIKQYGVEGALRAYNAGPGAIEASKGYDETNNYVNKILGQAGNPSPVGVPNTGPASAPDTPTHNIFSTIANLQATQPNQNPLQQQLQRGWELMASLRDQQSVGDAGGSGSGIIGQAALGSDMGKYGGKLGDIVSEANLIDKAQVPYLWGGGHGGKQMRGSEVTPVDCSGAVSRVLGIDPRVSGQFEAWGKPGEGKRVTIYANGTHVLMKINGHFWGTSDANPGGGAGWIPDSQFSQEYLSKFTARHPPGL